MNEDLLFAAEEALKLIKDTWIEEHGNPKVGIVWGALEQSIENAKKGITPKTSVKEQILIQKEKWGVV